MRTLFMGAGVSKRWLLGAVQCLSCALSLTLGCRGEGRGACTTHEIAERLRCRWGFFR